MCKSFNSPQNIKELKENLQYLADLEELAENCNEE